MTRRAVLRAADVTRAIKGAIAAGLAPGSFTVEIGDGIVRLLPLPAPGALASRPDNDHDDWDARIAQWRPSR